MPPKGGSQASSADISRALAEADERMYAMKRARRHNTEGSDT
jgi:hypothetical protein